MRTLVDKPDFIILSHQRSGTHFLQACLASHPGVHGRDECLMHFRRSPSGKRDAALVSYDLRNRSGRCNIAIVMYSQVALYGRKIGSLNDVGIIHLLREPKAVALSVARMKADKLIFGPAYRPHYHRNEKPHASPPVSDLAVSDWCESVERAQGLYLKKLKNHSRMLVLRYEEITGNKQTNTVPVGISRRLLDFLDLPYRALTNNLRKTGG